MCYQCEGTERCYHSISVRWQEGVINLLKHEHLCDGDQIKPYHKQKQLWLRELISYVFLTSLQTESIKNVSLCLKCIVMAAIYLLRCISPTSSQSWLIQAFSNIILCVLYCTSAQVKLFTIFEIRIFVPKLGCLSFGYISSLRCRLSSSSAINPPPPSMWPTMLNSLFGNLWFWE